MFYRSTFSQSLTKHRPRKRAVCLHVAHLLKRIGVGPPLVHISKTEREHAVDLKQIKIENCKFSLDSTLLRWERPLLFPIRLDFGDTDKISRSELSSKAFSGDEELAKLFPLS